MLRQTWGATGPLSNEQPSLNMQHILSLITKVFECRVETNNDCHNIQGGSDMVRSQGSGNSLDDQRSQVPRPSCELGNLTRAAVPSPFQEGGRKVGCVDKPSRRTVPCQPDCLMWLASAHKEAFKALPPVCPLANQPAQHPPPTKQPTSASRLSRRQYA